MNLVRLRLVAVLFICLSFMCVTEKDDVNTGDALSEVYAAIQFKARQCGNSPGYPFIPLGHPTAYGTRLCSLSIIRADCPFNDYPIFCLEFYEGVDIPGIGP